MRGSLGGRERSVRDHGPEDSSWKGREEASLADASSRGEGTGYFFVYFSGSALNLAWHSDEQK